MKRQRPSNRQDAKDAKDAKGDNRTRIEYVKSTGKCPKCGSSAIIAGARMMDRGDGNMRQDLQAATYDRPNAFIFKGQHTFTVNAWICRHCGFTELYSAADE